MSSVRDLILDADDLDSETVDVPEWGVTIVLRAPSGSERAAMMRATVSESGESKLEDWSLLWPVALAMCAHDPSSGERVFTMDDVPALQEKSAAVLERLGDRCLALAGLKPDAVDEGKGSSS